MNADFVPTGDQRIQCMFYSGVSDEGGPIMLKRDEYPEIRKQSVSWSEQNSPKKTTLTHWQMEIRLEWSFS